MSNEEKKNELDDDTLDSVNGGVDAIGGVWKLPPFGIDDPLPMPPWEIPEPFPPPYEGPFDPYKTEHD